MASKFFEKLNQFFERLTPLLDWVSRLGAALSDKTNERVKLFFSALITIVFILVLGALLALLRSCGEDDSSDSVGNAVTSSSTSIPAPVVTIASTTTSSVPASSTTVEVSTTLTTAKATENTAVVKPTQTTAAKRTTTSTAPTTATTTASTTTTPPTTTVASTTTAATTTTAAATTTTAAPTTTTTTTVAGRAVTFDFVGTWSASEKTATITNVTSLASVDYSAWRGTLPDGTTSFSFRMYRYLNNWYTLHPGSGDSNHPTEYDAASVNTNCVDGGSQNDLGQGVMAGYYRVVTCTATGTGAISIPLMYVP